MMCCLAIKADGSPAVAAATVMDDDGEEKKEDAMVEEDGTVHLADCLCPPCHR